MLPFAVYVGLLVLEKIRVVLVNTSHPGNIGGAARAMKNMGLSRLVLVDPQDFPSSEAVARASGAVDILDGAHIVGTLEEALVGCSLVLGTSARDRHIPWPLLDPRECATASLQQVEQGGEVALVFGREYAGLTNEELQRCHYHVHIPSDPEFSSLNLGAAVQVLTYEVRMAWLAAAGQIFFTLSVGMGTVHCYASYVRSKDDIALNAMSAGWMNEFVEVVLGAAILIPISIGSPCCTASWSGRRESRSTRAAGRRPT